MQSNEVQEKDTMLLQGFLEVFPHRFDKAASGRAPIISTSELRPFLTLIHKRLIDVLLVAAHVFVSLGSWRCCTQARLAVHAIDDELALPSFVNHHHYHHEPSSVCSHKTSILIATQFEIPQRLEDHDATFQGHSL